MARAKTLSSVWQQRLLELMKQDASPVVRIAAGEALLRYSMLDVFRQRLGRIIQQ